MCRLLERAALGYERPAAHAGQCGGNARLNGQVLPVIWCRYHRVNFNWVFHLVSSSFVDDNAEYTDSEILCNSLHRLFAKYFYIFPIAQGLRVKYSARAMHRNGGYMRIEEKTRAAKRVIAMLQFITTTELAELSGVSVSALNRIEMGFAMRPATADAIKGAWAMFCQQQLEQGKC